MNAIDGWISTTLGDSCKIEIGGTPSRSTPSFWDTSRSTKNLWVSIRDLNQSVIYETNEYISDNGVKQSNVKIQKTGTILLSFKLTIGKVAYAGTDLYTNEAIAGLQPHEIKADFLYHGLQYWDLLLGVDQAIKGATLNKAKLKEIAFQHPISHKEQAQIATILSTIDKAIEQTEAIIAKQQRIKTGLMQDLLTRGIDEAGNIRSEATHEFKDSPLGRIPMEWEVKTLASVSEFITSGSRGWAQYYSVEGATFIRIGNLTREHINLRLDDIIHVQPPESSEGKRTSVLSGDILISITADLGIIGVVPANLGEAYVNQHVALLRPKETGELSRFWGWYLSSRRGQVQIEKLNESGAKAGLSLPSVGNLLVPDFSERERVQITKQLDRTTNAIIDQNTRLAKLRRLKAGLMQDLLTGKVRVTDLLTPSNN